MFTSFVSDPPTLPDSQIPVLPRLKQFSTDEEPLYFEDSTQLTCYVIQGDSPFTFQWLFQNKTIEDLIDVRIEDSAKRSILSIDSVSARHAGEYACKVLNRAGFSTITTNLVVKGGKKLLLNYAYFRYFSVLSYL
jgi:Immunoglobulin domain